MASERVTKVTLRAVVDDYKKGMLEAAQATRTVGTEAEKLAQTRQAMTTLGTTSIAAGALIAAGVGVAIAKYAEFDKAISEVSATGSDARNNLDELRDAAIEAGASTIFSATESANAIEELAKAGVEAADILSGGLTGALNLAAAGGLGVAEAAGIAATTMKQFELGGEDASHVADLLAAGAAEAMGGVDDLSQALNQAGLVANQFGIPVEEAVGTLSAFASAGMLGSDAGTSFRTMLLRLANPTEEVKDLMAELGIEAYDSSGQFIGLAGLAGELEGALGGMTQQQKDTTLAMIFGQDAIRGANILLREGEQGIRDWTSAVDDQGRASRMAEERLDNLAGDFEKLQGALDTAFITMGEGANGPLRALIQGLAGAVDGFNDLPDGVQQSVLLVGAVISAVSLLAGGLLIGTIKLAEFRVALNDLNITGSRVKSGLGNIVSFLGGPWGIAMLAATAATLGFNKAIEAGLPSQSEIKNAVSTSADAVDSLAAAFRRGQFESTLFGDYGDQLKDLPGLLDKAASAGWRWAELTFNQQGALDSLKRYGDALADISRTDLPSAQAAFADLVEGYELTDKQARQLLDEMPAFRDALLEQASAQNIAADSAEFMELALGELPEKTEAVTQSVDGLAEAADQAESDLSDMREALSNVGDTALTMGEALDNAQSALEDMGEAAAVEGAALDGADDASRAFRDSIREVETSHREAAAAILENGGTLEDATGKYYQGRDAVIAMLEAKGLDRDAAVAWADANLGSAEDVVGALGDVSRAVQNVPDRKVIQLVADTAPAMAAINKFVFDNNGRRINFYVDGYVGRQVAGSDVVARASGGPVFGPGTGTSDSVPALLSNGEHVITAAEVRAAGGHAAVEKWRRSLTGSKQVYSSEVPGSAGNAAAAPSFPDRITLVDADGSILAHAKVIADEAAVSATSGFASTFRGGRR